MADPSGIELRRVSPFETDQPLPLVRECDAEAAYRFDPGGARAALPGLLADARLGKAWLLLDAGRPAGYGAVCLGRSHGHQGRDAFVDDAKPKAQASCRSQGCADDDRRLMWKRLDP